MEVIKLMKNNKKFNITMGVAFFIAFFAFSIFSNFTVILNKLNIPIPIFVQTQWYALISIIISYTFLGLSEGFFIKTGKVPKWARYIIYF